MSGKSRWFKIIGFSLLIGVLLGGGITGARLFFAPGARRLLQSGEDAYAKGVEALKAGDAARAAARFDEANLQAHKTLDAAAKEREKLKDRGGEEGMRLTQIEGEALWLKARAVRDYYFARGIAEGKPLAETTDSVTGEKFRSVFAIPDAQARGEAHVCLREASRRLPSERDLQKEALRNEVMIPALAWDVIERLAKANLEFNAKDPWSLYLLARYHFEQPSAVDTGPGARPPAQRGRDRILEARKYVTRLKETGNYPLWRTLYLEAQIVQWLRDNATASARGEEDAKLRSLLLAPDGALARARAGEKMEHLSSLDAQGVLGLHLMALELAVEDSRQPDADTEKVVERLNATLELCRQLSDKAAPHATDCALSAVDALAKVQPILASEPPSDWKKDFDLVRELVGKARRQKGTPLKLYEDVAVLLAREAHIEGKRGDAKRRAELNKQALQEVEEGLRQGAESKTPPAQLMTLNTLAAEMKALGGAKPEEITANLAALRESKSPRAAALVDLVEAAAAQRAGRLNQARKLLEQVLAGKENDLILRAHMILGGIYLALGQPDKALTSLQQVENAYKVFDQLSAREKAWATEFVRSPEDLALLMVSAHADSALAKARAFEQRNPGKPLPLATFARHEKAIAELRKKFALKTPQDRQARQIMAAYYRATGRKELAEKEAKELRGYYPDSVDALRTEVNVLTAGESRDRAEALQEAGRRIERFIAEHPSDLDARFYKAEWLMGSGRAGDAVAYLQSPADFPDTKSERYQRVLAAALLSKGDQQASQEVLRHLPHNAEVDALMIQAASAADREKLVRQALTHHESNGLFQTWQGVLAYNKRDYAAAAEAFLRASEYTRYEAAAKRGLLQALLSLAENDPNRARDLAVRMHKTLPDEPLLLLASAFAALMLDDIGAPADKADPVQSMASALNAWERLVLEQQPDAKAAAPLTRSVFWAMAGRQDVALGEAVRALNMDPKNEATLQQTIILALELRDPNQYSKTQQRLDALKRVQPDKPETLLLQARLDEQDGRLADAIQVCEELLQKSPKEAAAYARLIDLLVRQGDPERAREYVQRWRKALPEDVAAVQNEVRLLAAAKDFARARQVADAFIEEQAVDRPDEVRLHLRLRMILGLLQGKAWEEAEIALQRILDQKPDLETALLLLGDSYLHRESWEKARQTYAKVLAKNKNNVQAANNLAWILARHLDDAPGALRIIRELRKGRFSHQPIGGDRLRPEILDTLGIIYAKMGKGSLYPEMRDVFEAARLRYPRDPRMYMYLGHAYAGLLEMEKAERLYAAAIEVARGAGQKVLTPEQCQEVIDEIEAAQKKIKRTAQR